MIDEHDDVVLERQLKEEYSERPISNYEMVKYVIAGEWFSWLFFIKKPIISDIRFDENSKFLEDMKFFARIFAQKELKCGYCLNRYYAYRHRSNSITTTANVQNLENSFSLCEVFAKEANSIIEPNLKNLYWYYSIMMYYWTLATLSENPYYHNRKQIINDLYLRQLHNRTVKRLSKCKFLGINYLFILPSPIVGAMLLRLKNKITVNVYKLIRR